MPRKPKRGKRGREKDRVPPKRHPAHEGIRIETHGPHSGDTAFRYVLYISLGEGTAKRRVDVGRGFGAKGAGRTGALHAARKRIDADQQLRSKVAAAILKATKTTTSTTTPSQTEAA